MRKKSRYLLGGLAFLLTGCPPPIPDVPPITPPNTDESGSEQPYEETEPIVETITPIEVSDEDPIEPEEPILEPPYVEPRGDLLVTMNMTDYKVGDAFEYSGKIQSARLENISVNENDLEWRLLKQKEIHNSEIIEGFDVIFKTQGYIEVAHFNGKAKVTTSNTAITYEGKTYNIPHPLAISFTRDVDSFVFEEPGTYCLELLTKYSYEGEEYDAKFKGEDFEVE